MTKKIAFIGTGGTMASLGKGRFDLLDYNQTGLRIAADEVLTRTGIDKDFPNVVPIAFRTIDSTAITPSDWAELAELCVECANEPEISGIVIGHGTASLEETAWLLSLVLTLNIPVVVTGSMRPLNGISSDVSANLAGAIAVARATEGAAGVYVVMNDEIHAPRFVAKTHSLRLGAFQSLWHGPIGHVEAQDVVFSSPLPSPPTTFDVSMVRRMPRVDICMSHIGADGAAIDAFVAAGAAGIVSAGFGPGDCTELENAALDRAITAGVCVVQSTKCGAGLAVDSKKNQARGILSAGDLSPSKARILLALCLARGDETAAIREIFLDR